jgi:hypothetical protein
MLFKKLICYVTADSPHKINEKVWKFQFEPNSMEPVEQGPSWEVDSHLDSQDSLPCSQDPV